VFAEKGFGAARLEEVARRAGVSKGTVFVYFPTKQDLFRAVARSVIGTNFEPFAAVAVDPGRPLSELVPLLLAQMAVAGESRVAAVIRLIVAEARAFPDLAQVWHDEVAARMLSLLSAAIARAQARGEVRAGDPRLYAFSIVGPMLGGALFREVFGATGADLPDLRKLAAQHAAAILRGLETAGAPEE
jgi:AcrR family transcriptional regulator